MSWFLYDNGLCHEGVNPSKADQTDKNNDSKNQADETNNNYASRSLQVLKNDSVLLQAARADVSSTDEKFRKNVRILFDSRTQLNYIRPHTCWKLCMKMCVWKLIYRSSRPEVFLGKGVLKMCSKFTGEHPRRSAISITLLCNFIDAFVSEICHLLEEQNIINLAQSQLDHLKNLNLQIKIQSEYQWILIC